MLRPRHFRVDGRVGILLAVTQLTDGAPDPTGGRQWTPFAIVTAIVIPLLAIAVTVVIAVSSTSGGQKSPAATDRAGTCLLGLWNQTTGLPTSVEWDNDQVPATKHGGVTVRFGTDGSGSVEFAMDLTAKRGTDTLTQAWTGEFTFNYTLDAGTVAFHDVVDHTSVLDSVNGKAVGSPAHVPSEWTSSQIVCGPSDLTMTDAAGPTAYTRA
jgi:hypothetical protein